MPVPARLCVGLLLAVASASCLDSKRGSLGGQVVSPPDTTAADTTAADTSAAPPDMAQPDLAQPDLAQPDAGPAPDCPEPAPSPLCRLDPIPGCALGAPTPDATPCNLACKAGATCIAGDCTGGTERSCDDADPCTVDRCDEALGCLNELDLSPACCALDVRPLGGALTFDRGTVEHLATDGELLFVAAGEIGLQVFEGASSGEVAPLGAVDTPGYAIGVAVDRTLGGPWVYVADNWMPSGSNAGLRVVDVSDPKAPKIVGETNGYGLVKGVDVANGYAYVAEFTEQLRVVDVSDPTAPFEVASRPIGDGWAVQVDGDRVYVLSNGCGSYEPGVHVFDISQPTAPVQLAHVPTFCYPQGLFAQDGIVWVLDYMRFRSFDLSDPGHPKPLATRDGIHSFGRRIQIVDGLAYVASSAGALRVLEPDGSTVTSRSVEQNAGAVLVAGSRAWVGINVGASYNPSEEGPGKLQDRLVGFDLADPRAPQQFTAIQNGGSANAIALYGDYALVADRVGGLQVLEITDPALPRRRAQLDLPGAAQDLAIADDRVVVVSAPVTSGTEFHLVSVVNTTAPVLLSTIQIPGREASVAFDGQRAAVVTRYDWPEPEDSALYLVDVSDNTPLLLGSVALDVVPRDVVLAGDIVYAADNDVFVVDASDPLQPRIVAQIRQAYGQSLVLVGDVLVVVSREDSAVVRTYDVSNPADPLLLTELETTFRAEQASYAAGRLYVTAGAAGLHVVDVSDPLELRLTGQVQTRGLALDVAVRGNVAFVADGPALLTTFTGVCE